jgi:cellulose synthase/poly-beta-1,6-N-acetylglucosamine synthase-like glycosyltransferase
MVQIIIKKISEFIQTGLLFYCITLMSSYLILGTISLITLRKYLKKSKHIDYNYLLPSFLSPSISLIAPAYNEGLTIVENIRSLISLHYSDFEVVIVNDGSKDDTLEKAVIAYKMVPIDVTINEELVTKRIKNIYKSTLPAFKNLILIDKENGGKADALNAGINIAASKYVACIDVDCILEQDSLLKLIKPFLDGKKRVIATGGVIRIVNSCTIKNGIITKVRVPDSWVARMQVLEYLRAFLLGRMAWGAIDGLLLISGAFGMFDKEIVKKVGGYKTTTVGEDMDLVVRMSCYMVEKKLPYKVKFIPDPLCWTEAPEDLKILGRQRNRWTRGTVETLWYHKKMFFNPKYGVLGILSYPYWFFFEFLAPIVEFLGLIWMFIAAILGIVNWHYFLILTFFVYSFVIMINMFAILAEEITYYQYKDFRDIKKLVASAMIEPFFYHPFLIYSALMGHIDLIKGKKTWGEMTRKGLKTN